jgi:glutamate dehydrogenase
MNTRWQQQFSRLATRAVGESAAAKLHGHYQTLFSGEYQALVSPRYALQDCLHLEKLAGTDAQSVSLLRPCQGVADFRLHFYSQQERFLDEYIPLLENLSLRVMDQVQFRVALADKLCFIKSFTVKPAKTQPILLANLRPVLLAALQAVMDGKVENDPLNKLCVLAGLAWQEVDLLRAYRNYFLQLDHRTSRISVHHALITYPAVAQGLCRYFAARFRPDPQWHDALQREEQALFPLRLQLLESLKEVADMNADRILRTLFNLMDATMRSNFYVRRELIDYFIAFKINSLGVIDMPMPKPQAEIYVHAADMEGIHLRGGKISRGGIRWSDRPDDFRTEILGLMQTQISKNALIIPTGAKGGFIVKNTGGHLDFRAAGKQAYLKLMHGLLDLTDNLIDGQPVTPAQLVVYDDPDPYLVVAADKGTAAFSDIANGVAGEYQFWLGDAFASGGSYGYDHKALGITARGAWECVKRHFREIGKDIQQQAFSVVGIGSMDGDVFGNGMLLSPHIQLRAAFSGQHIFIDPNPPTDGRAFAERQRLFRLPGSSWNDYARELISEGGGVYARADKDIAISPQVKAWLGVRYKSLDGETLIRALLAAPVDLLWLGGIGTYVKASDEKHEEVGDRSNDNVRINANELQATIVGEGANLGFTQKARIEFALQGGRINTDAVDNSAGVDTSDHEVNLKILLTGLQKQAVIADYQALFTDMTDAVCQLVLANNIAQSLCLSLEQRRNPGQTEAFLQLAERLEAAGFLDKAVESFPGNKAILARPGQGLTRPEFAVLLAASKRYLTAQLEYQADLLHDECCGGYLQDYFPALMGDYQTHFSSHPLAKEIKATMISNKIINQAGCGFLNLAAEADNLLDTVSCYLSFDQIFDGDNLRRELAALDNQIAADSQYECWLQLEQTLLTACRWTLAHGAALRPDAMTLAAYRQYLTDYREVIKQRPEPLYTETCLRFQQAGVPVGLADSVAVLACLEDFAFLVSLAGESYKIATIWELYQAVNECLGLDKVQTNLANAPLRTVWEHTVANGLKADFKQAAGKIIRQMLVSRIYSCADYFAMTSANAALANYRRIYQEANATNPADLMAFVVLEKALSALLVG